MIDITLVRHIHELLTSLIQLPPNLSEDVKNKVTQIETLLRLASRLGGELRLTIHEEMTRDILPYNVNILPWPKENLKILTFDFFDVE